MMDAAKNRFNLPLSFDEPRPDKPFDLTVTLMGAEAHLATIDMGPSRVSKGGKLFAEVTISKGSALSDEFWEANGEKITEYISSKLNRYDR